MTNAPEPRSALSKEAAHWYGTLVVEMTRTRVRVSSGLHTLLAREARPGRRRGDCRGYHRCAASSASSR